MTRSESEDAAPHNGSPQCSVLKRLRAQRRVRITGLGIVSPLGSDRETTWANLIAGRRAPRWIDTEFGQMAGAPAQHPTDLLQRLSTFHPAPDLLAIAAEPTISMALAAAMEAVRDSQLSLASADRTRWGCVIGTSKGGVRTQADWIRGTQFVDDQAAANWLAMLPNGPAAAVSRLFQTEGPLLAPVTACATGLSSLVRAAELIRDDVCDVVITGSSDASLTPAILASFRKLGVLARQSDDPSSVIRPFDRDRSGFLVGEGAAMFVLESEESAIARGHGGYAEWLAGGGLADAVGLTQLSSDPQTLVRLIQDTLRRTDLAPSDVDYVSLHGTATPMNDRVEAAGLATVFGPDVVNSRGRRTCGSSLKGAIGHLLGAAGSVEFAALLLALRDGVLPPTANLTSPEFDFDFIPQHARKSAAEIGLKLSLGFGGHLVAAAVRRVAP